MDYSIRDIDAALLDAAKRGDLNEVKRLISKGADVNEVDTNYNNSLYLAVENDHLDIAKVLLDNGADFITFDAAQVRHVYDKFLKIQDEYCKSSLHLAARLGDLKAVEDLLKKEANVNAKNDKGQTPLHLTVEVCYVDIPNPDEVDDYWNQYIAAEKKCGNVKIAEALLGNKEINVNAQDKYGKTPFDLAKTEEIKALLLKAIEKTDDNSASTDSEGDQEEDTEPEDNVQPSLQEQKEESQEFIAEEVSDVQIEDADNGHSIDIALTKNGVSPQSESSTNEEQPSSFFSSLFGILIKPFSLIGSFLGGFFSWLFGSDEPSTESDQIIAPSNSGGEELTNYQEGDNNII
uniref:Ankyrin repeat domain-containing protein n=1 Tax=Wolbachia endosymbiont of Oeneis ivallda TaxID=3171168 RepID=A0AAU7YMH5_9RICK